MERLARMKLVDLVVNVCQDGQDPAVRMILVPVKINLVRMMPTASIYSKISSVCKYILKLLKFYIFKSN